MKKNIYRTLLLIAIFFSNQSFEVKTLKNSFSLKKEKKILTECILIFGIPITTSDYNGNNILFTTVTIYEGTQKFKANAEFRNQPIGAGHAIYLTHIFSDSDKAQITSDAIDKIEFTISIHQGSGNQQIRGQVVLKFSDGNEIASGSPDPAPIIFIKGGASTPKEGNNGVYTYSSFKPFLNKAILGNDAFNKSIMKEPVN